MRPYLHILFMTFSTFLILYELFPFEHNTYLFPKNQEKSWIQCRLFNISYILRIIKYSKVFLYVEVGYNSIAYVQLRMLFVSLQGRWKHKICMYFEKEDVYGYLPFVFFQSHYFLIHDISSDFFYMSSTTSVVKGAGTACPLGTHEYIPRSGFRVDL